MPIHEDVEVELVGQDGNAMLIIGRVSKALKRAGYVDSAQAFAEEAMSGDYNNVLATTQKYVTVS